MLRILVQVVLPVLLPSLLYALWLTAERRRHDAAGGEKKADWREAPWIWLLLLGLFFAAIIAVAIALFGGDAIEGVYVPPQLRDGRIVPGHVEPR